ncbi:MAG: helix-turn-helix domain-containing protein [Spirochaetes bacterium]|nr:helix-turn-helix domain-containing protein [Spirochaetota bacterium]
MNDEDGSTGFQPAEEFEIDDIDTLKVVADPYRMGMIEAIGADQITAKQWADRLGDDVHKLYYHIRLLEKHGIVTVVEERVVSGIIEKTYALTANRFQMKPGLLSASPEADATLEATLTSLLDSTASAVRRAFRSGDLNIDDKEHTMLFRATLRLTPDRAAELTRRVEELFKEVDSDHEDAERYGITIVFHPLAKDTSNE